MIPFLTYKKAVDRFTRAAKEHEKSKYGFIKPLVEQEMKAIEFEYRDAKRALYDLGKLLITGEVPNRSMK